MGNRIVDFVNLVVFVDVIDLRAAAVVASRRGNSSVQITSTFSIVINFITREIRLGSFGCRFQRRALRSQPPVSSRRPNQLDFFCFDCRFKGNSQHTRLSPKLQAPTPNFFFNFSNQFSPFSLLKQQNRHGREKFKIFFFFFGHWPEVASSCCSDNQTVCRNKFFRSKKVAAEFRASGECGGATVSYRRLSVD